MVAKALTIAGSDSGGGAGIQADLKAFCAMGVFGCSVVTAVTAQNTRDVTAVHPIPDDVVAAQIKAVLDDIEINAIKIGMLGSPALIETIAKALGEFNGPVVLDPVMVAKSGVGLLADCAVTALRQILVPRADLLTPNLPEAAKLLGLEDTPTDAEEAQATALLDLGAKAVLLKGGHGSGEPCIDLLCTAKGISRLTAPRVDTTHTHGTGCSYASAIAGELAKGSSLKNAVARAHSWLHTAIKRADTLDVGRGHGPVHHFHEFWG